MEKAARGWIYIIGALVAGYFAWQSNLQWSAYVIALLFLISGYHHAFGKHK